MLKIGPSSLFYNIFGILKTNIIFNYFNFDRSFASVGVNFIKKVEIINSPSRISDL
jgi:hypothetical protein